MAIDSNAYSPQFPQAAQSSSQFLKTHDVFFDTRLYRSLELYGNNGRMANYIYPHTDYGSYSSDFYPTASSLAKQKELLGDDQKEEKEALQAQINFVKDFTKKADKNGEYYAPHAFVHPYALVKLAGAYGNETTAKKNLTYDRYNSRKFYEIDGESSFSGNYSKSPTTTTLIRWGSEFERNQGKTPYCFQDFVFCKWWNRIENNRMITLRRYAAPVSDNIEFPDYDTDSGANDGSDSGTMTLQNPDGSTRTIRGTHSHNPWTPLATAVTYFGEDTGNNLSDILNFSAQYNWEQISHDDNHPFDITSSQNDAGTDLVNDVVSGMSGGLSVLAKVTGFLGDIASGGKTINLEAAAGTLPPDPYSDGPYENRILGPINVITNTYKRKRGLHFSNEGLKLQFDYVARPIAGINNKAVLLDMLSNILLLTYSSGSWYGGMWRYHAEKPSVYPFKYGDEMNKLYKGDLFGKDGVVPSLTQHVFEDGKDYISNFLPDAMNMISNLFTGAVDKIMSIFTSDDEKKKARKEKAATELMDALNKGTAKTLQKILAVKVIKGRTIPYIKNQRALLTGDPVGDWHLTIGNPLNPIAMIGNLIVKDVNIKFSDELGPDDFPIGFTAVITLDHGMGRDRDAIESMFNRGYGRIYTLSSEFRSSADGETKVDDYTGGVNTDEGRTVYDEIRNTYFGGGYRFIAKIQQNELKNKGAIYTGDTLGMKSLKPKAALDTAAVTSSYVVNPWQMGMTL